MATIINALEKKHKFCKTNNYTQYILLPPEHLELLPKQLESSSLAAIKEISTTRLLMILVVGDVQNENWNDAQLVSFRMCSHSRWPPA